jgi:hypothetical protein
MAKFNKILKEDSSPLLKEDGGSLLMESLNLDYFRTSIYFQDGKLTKEKDYSQNNDYFKDGHYKSI